MARQPLFGRRYDAGRERLMNNPQYRAGIQAQQRGMSTEPVSSPWEGLARALQAPLGAVMAGQEEAAMRERQGERNQMIADMLLGEPRQTGEVQAGTGQQAQAVDPRREQLMTAMEAGIFQPEDLSSTVMREMGIGPQAEPIEVNGRLVDPNTYEVIQDFSDPNIRSVNGRLVNVDTGQVMADFSDPQRMSASDLVPIMTDQGPQYVPASQAAGQRVYEGGQDQRGRRIGELTRRLGGGEQARQRATDIVDGNTDIEIVPETGRARLINKVTNEVEEVPIGAAQGQDQARGDLPSEPLYESAEEGTGLWSAAKEAWSGTGGQIWSSTVAEDTVQARSNIRTATRDVIRAMSLSPKYPVAEQERIRRDLSLEPSLFDSPGELRARMEEVDRSAQSMLQQAERDAADQSLPEETRSAQAQTASALRNFRQRMGVPQNAGQGNQQQVGGGNLPRPQTPAEVEDLPSGTEFIDPNGVRRRKP